MKVDIKKLEKLLKVVSHKAMVNDVAKVARGKYMEYACQTFSIFVPFDMKDDELMPCIVSHTDTVSQKKPKKLSLTADGMLYNPDGVLGADDRAGVYIIYEMMKRGERAIYILTDMEECGGIGASDCAGDIYFNELAENNISCLIELDRENKDHCATYGYDNGDLIKIFEEKGGYKEEYGTYTDVATLADATYLACVNLSVGYYNQHTKKEHLIISELEATLNFMIDMPKELYEQRFEVDEAYQGSHSSKFDWGWGYSKRESHFWEAEEVCCEICKDHDKLYRYEGVLICENCLEWYEDYKDVI